MNSVLLLGLLHVKPLACAISQEDFVIENIVDEQQKATYGVWKWCETWFKC